MKNLNNPIKQLASFLSILVLIILLSTGNCCYAQNVGINSTGAAPSNSAILDVSSTTKGVLISRMTTTQRDSIPSPDLGLQIFNTDCGNFNYYNGIRWIATNINIDNLPAVPGTITGPATVCIGDTGITYSISAVTGATSYTWTVPAGATITHGQGTISIKVTFGSTGGNISVIESGACGTSSASILAVGTYSPLSTPGTPTASVTNICLNQAGVTFSVTAVSDAISYNWSLPTGATITGGGGTNNITVTMGNTAGNYNVSVTASNGCGASAYSPPLPISVNVYFTGSDTFNETGAIQYFTIPCGISSITITAYGAHGGGAAGYIGGSGAMVQGTFSVTAGHTLKVLVGQIGDSIGGNTNGGGGGGSYVWDTLLSNYTTVPMIAAGGGGGGGTLECTNSCTGGDGSDTQTPTTGGGILGSVPGGSGGTGGTSGSCTIGAGGGGWLGNSSGNGADPSAPFAGPGGGGKSALNGGAAGIGANGGANGGFGGGGGGNQGSGGGGGGYNGGGGADYSCSLGSGWGAGGGGGSYNGGAYPSAVAGGNPNDNGQVIISW